MVVVHHRVVFRLPSPAFPSSSRSLVRETNVFKASSRCQGTSIDVRSRLPRSIAWLMVASGGKMQKPTGCPRDLCASKSAILQIGVPCMLSVVGLMPTGVLPDRYRVLHLAGFKFRPICADSVETVLIRVCSMPGPCASGVRSSAYAEIACFPLPSCTYQVYVNVKKEPAEGASLANSCRYGEGVRESALGHNCHGISSVGVCNYCGKSLTHFGTAHCFDNCIVGNRAKRICKIQECCTEFPLA